MQRLSGEKPRRYKLRSFMIMARVYSNIHGPVQCIPSTIPTSFSPFRLFFWFNPFLLPPEHPAIRPLRNLFGQLWQSIPGIRNSGNVRYRPSAVNTSCRLCHMKPVMVDVTATAAGVASRILFKLGNKSCTGVFLHGHAPLDWRICLLKIPHR